MDTSFSAAYLTADNARLTARIAELEEEVERLREEADPPRCGNCSLRVSEECRRSISEWDEPCNEYVRDAALAEKE